METILAHHGIKGQKWGIRRFQNRDGIWTSAGKERYGDDTSDTSKTQKSTKKKVATGVVVGTAAVAGVVLTAKAAVQRTAEATKPTVEKVLETAKKAATSSAGPVSTPKVSVGKPSFDIPSTYNFETLMKQNDDLLKKMLDDLVS